MSRFFCWLRRHRDWWIVVDNGSGTRLLQCRACGRYVTERDG